MARSPDWFEGGTGNRATEAPPAPAPSHWSWNPDTPATPPKQERGTTTTQTTHPDVKALHKAGIHPDRVHELGKIHMVEHPAIDPSLSLVAKGDPELYKTDEKLKAEVGALGKTLAAQPGANADQKKFVDNPKDPASWAKDILIAAGLPDTKSNEALIERQMQIEGMPGSENNPLATTLPEKGSQSVNSVGVQEYPNTQEGVQADAAAIENTPMAQVLASGKGTPQDYATALANSNYEGSAPSARQANIAYGQSFLGASPESSFPGGNTPTQNSAVLNLDPTQAAAIAQGQMSAGQTLANAGNTNFFGGLTNLFQGLGGQNVSGLQQALQGLNPGSNQATLTANTTNAPGSPDQTPSQMQETTTKSPAEYQQLLQAILGKALQSGGQG